MSWHGAVMVVVAGWSGGGGSQASGEIIPPVTAASACSDSNVAPGCQSLNKAVGKGITDP